MPAVHAFCGQAACVPTAEPRNSSRPVYSNLLSWHRCRRLLKQCKRQRLSFEASAVAEGQLVQWLDLPPDKTLATDDDTGGLEIARRVSKGQAIFSIPASRWITPEIVAKSELGQYVQHLQPWVQLTLYIMAERANPRSQWRGYIEALPSSVESPLCWSDSELEELLSGTRLLDSVLGYRSVFEAKFEELEESVFEGNRSFFREEVFSKENFLRSAIVMRARVHPPLDNDKIALVPLADQSEVADVKVKHQRGSGAVWKVTPGGFGREKALVLEAEREFQAGEAVTMDYGPDKLDADLLLNYGVMDDFVTRTGFPLNLELPEDDEFFDDKADILEINGLSESQEFVLTSGEEPSPELLAFLRLINLSGADAFLLESLFRNDAWGHLLRPMSLENETAIFSSMLEGCRDALSMYTASVTQAKAALKSSGAGSRREKALRICIGEQEALSATLQFFEQRSGKLEGLEYYQERRLKGLGLLDEDGSSTFDSFFKDGIA